MRRLIVSACLLAFVGVSDVSGQRTLSVQTLDLYDSEWELGCAAIAPLVREYSKGVSDLEGLLGFNLVRYQGGTIEIYRELYSFLFQRVRREAGVSGGDLDTFLIGMAKCLHNAPGATFRIIDHRGRNETNEEKLTTLLTGLMAYEGEVGNLDEPVGVTMVGRRGPGTRAFTMRKGVYNCVFDIKLNNEGRIKRTWHVDLHKGIDRLRRSTNVVLRTKASVGSWHKVVTSHGGKHFLEVANVSERAVWSFRCN